MLKIIIILSFLLTGCGHIKFKDRQNPPSPYAKRLKNIKKATVLIQFESGVSKGKTGSGTLIKDPFYGTYILTNAHVCFEDLPYFLNNQKYKRKFLKGITKYSIWNQTSAVDLKIKNSELSYSLYPDICRIPVQEEKFDFSFHFLSNKSSSAVVNQLRKKRVKNNIFLFTRNQASAHKVLIKKGKEEKTVGDISMKIKSKIKNKKYEVSNGPVSYTSINVIPGDSGSLIYDKYLNIYGIVFGNSVTDTKVLILGRKKEKNDPNFSFYEELLNFYKVETKDLSEQKIQLKGLKGMFIKFKNLDDVDEFGY